ncbi:MAG: hypothetical protein H7A24_12870 [Leptospiraceae bacterium]|nr:hypothetical protein [Leptospiraceae bacterium]MCP5512769.1 hypothetical protein [Leptospiraceae bacterium]
MKRLVSKRIKFSVAFLILFLSAIFYPISATEEKNIHPFTHLISEIYRVKLPKDTKLCTFQSKYVFSFKKVKTTTCLPIEKNIYNTIQNLQQSAKEKKELKFGFFNSEDKIISPNLITDSEEYTLRSIIKNNRDKKFYSEVLDRNNKYFYFSINPSLFSVEEDSQ